MDDFVKVCAVELIPEDSILAVEIDGRPIAIGKVGDQYFAIEDVCPHQGASFDGGPVDDGILTCPLHGWRMNLMTGQSLEAPSIRLETYDVKVENGEIYVKL